MFRGLRGRLIILLLIANLPAVAVAVAVGLNALGSARSLKERALVQSGEIVAARAEQLLGKTGSVVATLALDRGVAVGGDPCTSRLQTVRGLNPEIDSLFLMDADGALLCASGPVPGSPGSRREIFQSLGATDAAKSVTFISNPFSSAEPKAVVADLIELADGSAGALAVAMDRSVFDALFRNSIPEPRAGAIETLSGEIIGLDPASGDLEWRPDPQAMPMAGSLVRFIGVGQDGARRLYARIPILDTNAHVLVSQRESTLYFDDRLLLVTLVGVPLAMIIFGVTAVLIGFDRWGLAWIRRLARATAEVAAGRTDQHIGGLSAAPREIRDLGDAFNHMIEAVGQRSVELQRALGQKDRLLRELHHRVKNNFQMIASLLAMQRRELDPDLRPLLRVPENRVLAMASAHKASYAMGDIGEVRVDHLLQEVSDQIRQSFGMHSRALKVVVAPQAREFRLDLDRAVPLSLLITEILSATLQRGDGGGVEIALRACSDEGTAVMVRAAGVGDAVPRDGLAGRLVAAYVSQLSATLETSEDAGEVRIVVPRGGPATAG